MKELEPKQKETVRSKMESIKDEVEMSGDQKVKDITYYKQVEVAGIPMDLYYVASQGEDEKVSYQLFNGSKKIGEGSKTGKQIKIDSEFLEELEKKAKSVDRDYSLDEYGGDNIKLKTEEMEKDEVCKMSELEEKKKNSKDVILPGLEEEEPSEIQKVEEKMKLTRVQRISGKEAAAVLGNDTQNYKDLYIGYSDETQSFIAVGVNGNEMKPIDGVKSYRVTAGGEEGKEEYFLSGEINPTFGGIKIVDEVGINDLDVSVHRLNEKGQCEITELDDFGHAVDKKGIDRDGNEVLDKTEDNNSMKEDDDRGEERVLGPSDRHRF